MIADSGPGIRATLSRNPCLPETESDQEAIGLAIQELVSGTGVPTRGIGLWMTVNEMKRPGRKLWLHSGSGLLTMYGASEPELREINHRQGGHGTAHHPHLNPHRRMAREQAGCRIVCSVPNRGLISLPSSWNQSGTSRRAIPVRRSGRPASPADKHQEQDRHCDIISLEPKNSSWTKTKRAPASVSKALLDSAHLRLDKDRPAEQGKINPSFREWAGVVKGDGAYPSP